MTSTTKIRRESSGGMEWLGVWNDWGYGIAFFRARNFQSSEPEIWRKSLFCGISCIFLEISASEKMFSDSGKWPFHAPPIHTPIHTPTKCRPKNAHLCFFSFFLMPNLCIMTPILLCRAIAQLNCLQAQGCIPRKRVQQSV